MVFWERTGDPVTDFEAYDAALSREAERFPECDECGEKILEDDLYVKMCGGLYHLDCLREMAVRMGGDGIA